MKRKLLITTAIVAGAMWFHHPVANATVTVCGPDNAQHRLFAHGER